MKLPLDTIILDPELQIRPIQPAIVERYADNLAELPAPIVYHDVDANVYLLAAGFHRVHAALHLGWDELEVEVRDGTRTEALICALTSNSRHGLPLTREEWRQVVLRLGALRGAKPSSGGKDLPFWEPVGIVRQIAREIGRTHVYVDSVLRSDLVSQQVPGTKNMSPVTSEKLNAISRAPTETWKPLASAAFSDGWDTKETFRRVQAVNAGLPLDEVIDRPVPHVIPPKTEPATNLIDVEVLNQALSRFMPQLSVGRYDWGACDQLLGGLLLFRLDLLQQRIRNLMGFLLGQGYRPEADAEPELDLLEVGQS